MEGSRSQAQPRLPQCSAAHSQNSAPFFEASVSDLLQKASPASRGFRTLFRHSLALAFSRAGGRPGKDAVGLGRQGRVSPRQAVLEGTGQVCQNPEARSGAYPPRLGRRDERLA